MDILQKYIEMVDYEISELIKEEVESGRLSWEKEQELHLLFENCKHAKELMNMTKKSY